MRRREERAVSADADDQRGVARVEHDARTLEQPNLGAELLQAPAPPGERRHVLPMRLYPHRDARVPSPDQATYLGVALLLHVSGVGRSLHDQNDARYRHG